MDTNTEFLNYIYQNSHMGIDTIKQLLEIVEDKQFSDTLQLQLKEYENINNIAKKKLNDLGHQEKDIGNMQKIGAYMSISIKTLMDKSPAHIAEMLIEGSTMGIVDATKHINEYDKANKDIIDIANQLLKTEQNNVEQLKKFL